MERPSGHCRFGAAENRSGGSAVHLSSLATDDGRTYTLSDTGAYYSTISSKDPTTTTEEISERRERERSKDTTAAIRVLITLL